VSTRPTSSSSSSSSSRDVSASSSEDLFDESTAEQKSCASAAERETAAAAASDRRGSVPSRSELTCTSCDTADVERADSSQLVSTSDRAHPVVDNRPQPPRANCSAAHVTTFQITPTLRQRAFPRTNPAYIGTYRRDRPPAYRRIDLQSTSLGVASELSPAALNRRPNSDGLQRALIQHTADVVYLSNTGANRATNSTGHYSTTVVTHQRFNNRTGRASASVTSHGVVVRPQSDGGSSVLPSSDCRSFSIDRTGHCEDVVMTATGDVMRRQSEPDYVNILTRRHHHHHHQCEHDQQCYVPVAAARHYSDESERTSQLVPSAIYMNQHELTIAGRYTSRSTSNFMDPTANGKDDCQLIIPSFFPASLQHTCRCF